MTAAPDIAIDVRGLTKSFDSRQVVRSLSMQVKRVAFTALGQPCQFPESLACSISNSN